MARERKATKHHTLRLINGGKTTVRSAYEACRARGNATLDVNVITVLSPDDEAYAAEVAERVRQA